MPKTITLSDAAAKNLEEAAKKVVALGLEFTPTEDEVASLIIASTPAQTVAEEVAALFRPDGEGDDGVQTVLPLDSTAAQPAGV